MIKISELLVRKAGMSRGEFQDYWRRVHGPLVMSIPEIRRHVVKYVQSHTQPDWFPFLAGTDRVMTASPKFGARALTTLARCSRSRSSESW